MTEHMDELPGGAAVQEITPGQLVTLTVDGEPTGLACAVAAIEGRTATLVQTRATEQELLDSLEQGRQGFIVLATPDSTVGLRGAAIITPASRPLIEFVITD